MKWGWKGWRGNWFEFWKDVCWSISTEDVELDEPLELIGVNSSEGEEDDGQTMGRFDDGLLTEEQVEEAEDDEQDDEGDGVGDGDKSE